MKDVNKFLLVMWLWYWMKLTMWDWNKRRIESAWLDLNLISLNIKGTKLLTFPIKISRLSNPDAVNVHDISQKHLTVPEQIKMS